MKPGDLLVARAWVADHSLYKWEVAVTWATSLIVTFLILEEHVAADTWSNLYMTQRGILRIWIGCTPSRRSSNVYTLLSSEEEQGRT